MLQILCVEIKLSHFFPYINGEFCINGILFALILLYILLIFFKYNAIKLHGIYIGSKICIGPW